MLASENSSTCLCRAAGRGAQGCLCDQLKGPNAHRDQRCAPVKPQPPKSSNSCDWKNWIGNLPENPQNPRLAYSIEKAPLKNTWNQETPLNVAKFFRRRPAAVCCPSTPQQLWSSTPAMQRCSTHSAEPQDACKENPKGYEVIPQINYETLKLIKPMHHLWTQPTNCESSLNWN